MLSVMLKSLQQLMAYWRNTPHGVSGSVTKPSGGRSTLGTIREYIGFIVR
jgi:hypothetical protein